MSQATPQSSSMVPGYKNARKGKFPDSMTIVEGISQHSFMDMYQTGLINHCGGIKSQSKIVLYYYTLT